MGDESLTRLMGDPREIAMDRALAELRSGSPVVLKLRRRGPLVMSPPNGRRRHAHGDPARSVAPRLLVLSQPRLRSLGMKSLESPGIIPLDHISTSPAIHRA